MTAAMTTTPSTPTAAARERADLIQTLEKHRGFLRQTVRGITDDQARARTTVSVLCLGGLIKHVAEGERTWVDFILEGPSAMQDEGAEEGWPSRFRMEADDTLEGLLARYDEVAARTDALVATLDLDAAHPLPAAPWFEPGAEWSARRVLLHIIAETAQHAGHADIIRESIDGAKTMG